MTTPSNSPVSDILPIFRGSISRPYMVDEFCGTGFLIADHLIVTCWHCVAADLDENQQFLVARQTENGGPYTAIPLHEVSRDPSGIDLATASIDLKARTGLRLDESEFEYGTDVWSFGYPLTEVLRSATDPPKMTLHPRYLQGYVVRAMFYEHPDSGRIPAYELDLPVPAGLSGAPIVRVGSRQVMGVVFGYHQVAQIEELAFHDPATGETRPELQRLVTFGLGHFLQSLYELSGTATNGKPLAEFLAG